MSLSRNTASSPNPQRKGAGTDLLLGYALVLVILAMFGPRIDQAVHYHALADQRSLFGLAHALDVLSNLPFVLLGLLGLGNLRRIEQPLWSGLAATLAIGLLLTGLGSAWYHLQPDDQGLLWDRIGMGVSFAGVLGLAIADRAGLRAGYGAVALVLLGSALALWAWRASGNLLAWVILQGGGMLLLVLLAGCRTQPGGYAFRLGQCVLLYALAKLCELADAPLYQLSGELISGHSLKHLLAALAVLPLLLALQRNRGTPALLG